MKKKIKPEHKGYYWALQAMAIMCSLPRKKHKRVHSKISVYDYKGKKIIQCSTLTELKIKNQSWIKRFKYWLTNTLK